MSTRAAVVAVCHGGGPMPVMADPGHAELIQSMSTTIPKILGLGTSSAPKAIVLVTAHWQTKVPTISSASKHDLYYDYGGFPPEAYKLKYDAPGSPNVAKEVYDLLQGAGFRPEMDEERGWDHGVFVPMLLINPPANIPIIQVSVLSSSSPSSHYALGQALSPLRDQNIAILGSGMPTFHNLRLMFSGASSNPGVMTRNRQWSEQLTEVVKMEDSEKRGRELEGWRQWVGAKEAHPERGLEHFMPLLVCAGAAGEGEGEAFGDMMMGTKQYTYYWR
ncbi:Extradiol ring-cleavage dioxygenase, class III enzyme, subunit B [Amylocarpus encephaloides]|uniref:Extradiol ring-cleavage dioxygenase, class III enzyme, subunit B n=1 Tax=Amylocarpus encephaloides TaxID=45428 RepID=A0A9P7YTW5_9HELO|nr:Extradiol ring-cleavage dioxygenase, class III enzyme, subunit B [Amylocarpus encephaloides]